MTAETTGRRPHDAGTSARPSTPVISFVGRSGSGKTTLLEGVIRTLSGRGHAVGVIKHHGHTAELDVPKKDSWRHAQAGAVATVVSGPAQLALVRRVERERTLAELVELMPEVDIILTEGYRAQSSTSVEVLRRANSVEPVCSAEELFALATDISAEELPPSIAERIADGSIQLFGLDDAEAIADAVERATRREAVSR